MHVNRYDAKGFACSLKTKSANVAAHLFSGYVSHTTVSNCDIELMLTFSSLLIISSIIACTFYYFMSMQ